MEHFSWLQKNKYQGLIDRKNLVFYAEHNDDNIFELNQKNTKENINILV